MSIIGVHEGRETPGTFINNENLESHSYCLFFKRVKDSKEFFSFRRKDSEESVLQN